MKRTKRCPPKRRVVFKCDTCKDKPEFVVIDGKPTGELEDLKQHMKTVHKIRGQLKGKMTLVLALDGADYYNNTFECKIKGVTLIKNEFGPRGGWPL